jgi:TM2 domain-containing membrane protein YozV
MSDALYFFAENNQQRGPVTSSELLAKNLPPDTLVWREGMPQWQRLDSLPELIGLTNASRPPPPQFAQQMQRIPIASIPYGQAPPQVNRMAAGLCGIFLGWLGVHKFIINLPRPATIMCLTSVGSIFAGCCFFPFWIAFLVMGVIGFVEGVIYLNKSDEQFYQDYVIERRAWF